MVNDSNIKFIACLFLVTFSFSTSVYTQPQLVQKDILASIEVSIDSDPIYADRPIVGLITITHLKSQPIDVRSFKIGSAHLEVAFVKDVHSSLNPNLILSIFHFTIEPKPVGLQLLPAISVNVGENTYRSVSASYTVIDIPSTTRADTVLQLQGYVEGSDRIYPGQHVKLVYRFLFKGEIQLTAEYLPMLDATNLSKLGSKVIREGTTQNINIQEISQEYVARTPGIYTFPSSYIRGYGSTINASGQEVPLDKELQADTPSVTLIVNPFPLLNQPTSFNGAVGDFSLNISIPQTSDIHVGDTIKLALSITGENGLDSVYLPNLECEPGFSGAFSLGDLSTIGIITGNVKNFSVELKPLFTSVVEIPSIEFSFYDPHSNNYKILRSETVPIKVVSQFENFVAANDENVDLNSIPAGMWEKVYMPEQVMDNHLSASNQTLNKSDLSEFNLKLASLLYLIPALGFLLLFQLQLKKSLQERIRNNQPSSSELFHEANQHELGSSEYYDKLEEALLVKLVELKEIASPSILPEKLSFNGKSGLVKNFLSEISQMRYSGDHGTREINTKLNEAVKKLYKML